MPGQRLRVGIIGLQPGRSWAAGAHVPALQMLPGDYEVVGVANSSPESSARAAEALGLRHAFADARALAASPDIDVVTVTVKVPHHLELVRTALEGGKHVYCEWPLGNGLAEAQELADLARARGVLGVIGTQARAAPEIEYLRDLIADGFVGDLLSTTMVARGGAWGATVPDVESSYILDRANGATMLTIPFGHTLAAFQEVLGQARPTGSIVSSRQHEAVVATTGETQPMTSPDQVVVQGLLPGDAPFSIHYRGGIERDGQGFLWQINGTRGDIRVSAAVGQSQMFALTLSGAQGDETTFRPLEVPASYGALGREDVIPGNIARLYARMARDIKDGTRTAPSFDDGVALHQLIDTIERQAGARGG